MALNDPTRIPRRLARGAAAEVEAYTGPRGELIVNTDEDRIHVQDGSTAGGIPLARQDEVSALSFETRAIAIAAKIPASMDCIHLEGYASGGDGGAALYKRVAAPGTPDARHFQSSDGAWWELAEPVMNVNMFGAKGDGATDDSPAFLAAATAAKVGGTVVVPPNKTYHLLTDVAAPHRNFLVYGLLSGAGQITGENATVTQVRGYPQDAKTPFGAGFQANQIVSSNSNDPHSSSVATTAIVRKATGSTNNGPDHADMALLLSSEKKNWLTSQVRGEIDGLTIVVRQGQKDDQGGILIDHRKVGGDTGGSVGIETSGSWVNNQDTPTLRIQTIKNFLEGPGSVSAGTGYGFWAEAQLGTPFSAYHADQVTGSWQNFLTYTTGRSLSNLLFKVDGSGRVKAAAGSATSPSLSFHTDEDTGFSRASANAIVASTGGVARWFTDASGHFYPAADNAYSLGASTFRWSVVYAATGTISTSDEDTKQDIEPIPDAWLDAWAEVEWSRFKFRDAVATKGDKARWHTGLVAQRIRDAFAAHGIDAFEIGLLCYDEWDASPAIVADDGSEIVPAREAGGLYSIRPDECFAMEAALTRRTLQRLAQQTQPADL